MEQQLQYLWGKRERGRGRRWREVKKGREEGEGAERKERGRMGQKEVLVLHHYLCGALNIHRTHLSR